MKKRAFIIIIAVALFASSCSKNTVNPYAINAWYIGGQEYLQKTCTSVHNNQLKATSSSPASTLTATFTTGLPTLSGTYGVTGDSSNTTSNQVYFAFADSAGTQHAVSSGGTNQSVSVTVLSTGKVSMTGAGISLFDVNIGVSDTINMVISIAQQ